MALITTNEVLIYSVADREFGVEKIEQFREITESDYIRNLLGEDFYLELLDDVNDWSTVSEWDSETTYSLNNIVFWKGWVFKSTQGSNTEEPSKFATKWIEAPKFTISEFNTLWKKYLSKAVSNKIILDCAVLNTYRASGKGLGVSVEDNSNITALSKDEIGTWYTQVNNIVDKIESEMIFYIKSQYNKYRDNPATGYNYSTVGFISGDSENIKSTNKVARRILFRR